MISLDNTLVLAIVVLTAYSCVTDVPERQIVMTPTELRQRIQDERVMAAQEILDAIEIAPCPAPKPPNWKDLFVPPVQKLAPSTM